MSDQTNTRATGPDTPTPPAMPRWVKVAGVIVLALIVVFAVLRLTGLGGDHGPGRHMSEGVVQTVVAGGAPVPDGAGT